MSFEEARSEIRLSLGIQLSDSTVRRLTLQAGATCEQLQTEQAPPLSSRAPIPPAEEKPAHRLAMGSDGGMVPLRGGVWGEVKTLVIGQVQAPKEEQTPVRTTTHSYFSRLTDAATFADLASVEIERRGVATVKAVCAVQDGAEWLQGFVDGHRRDAVRILDFAHAAEYLGRIAEQAQQLGRPLSRRWLPVLLHQLKHHGPDRVMAHLQRLEARCALSSVSDALRYFGKRLAQMQYPQFQQAGWPIGSGMVESAHKLVMQPRLKGAGMHWEPANVNPMLVLRDALRNGRWEEVWQQQQQGQKDHRHAQRLARSTQKRTRLLQTLRAQIVRMCLLLLPLEPPSSPAPPKGRTQGQHRWGRQTFSSRAIQDGRFVKR